LGSKNSIPLLLSLLSTICYHTLLFGTKAALGTNKKNKKKLSFAYNRAWSKIFQTFDKDTILLCQYYSIQFNSIFYCGFVPLKFDIDFRKMVFIRSLVQTTNVDYRHCFLAFLKMLNYLIYTTLLYLKRLSALDVRFTRSSITHCWPHTKYHDKLHSQIYCGATVYFYFWRQYIFFKFVFMVNRVTQMFLLN